MALKGGAGRKYSTSEEALTPTPGNRTLKQSKESGRGQRQSWAEGSSN